MADILNFSIFFLVLMFFSDLLSFFSKTPPHFFFFLCSPLYCCICVLPYLYPSSPIQHRLPVESDLSFRDLLFSPDNLAVKASSLGITLCISLNLIDPFCQRAFNSIMCLFSLIWVIWLLCMSYCTHKPQHALLKYLGYRPHLLWGEESLCPSLLHIFMWAWVSGIGTQFVQEDMFFSFF